VFGLSQRRCRKSAYEEFGAIFWNQLKTFNPRKNAADKPSAPKGLLAKVDAKEVNEM
tara:strand:- start:29 stop:199 length:171 start_codon:yes stop_codon:yes gene_type:complete